MKEQTFSLDGIECRIVESGVPLDTSIFIWIGAAQQLFNSLILAYPPSSPTTSASSAVLMDYLGGSDSDIPEDWGQQMAKRLASKLKRPILLSFQPPADDGIGLDTTQRLRNVEKELVSQILSK